MNFKDGDFKVASFCSHCSHCVAVACKDDIIAVRDTKEANKLTLQFSKEEWHAFIKGVKKGEFDFK